MDYILRNTLVLWDRSLKLDDLERSRIDFFLNHCFEELYFIMLKTVSIYYWQNLSCISLEGKCFILQHKHNPHFCLHKKCLLLKLCMAHIIHNDPTLVIIHNALSSQSNFSHHFSITKTLCNSLKQHIYQSSH